MERYFHHIDIVFAYQSQDFTNGMVVYIDGEDPGWQGKGHFRGLQ